jgi:hypothetical protein
MATPAVLPAAFTNHAFPRHSHDHIGIGIMTFGAQRSWSIIGQVESEAGDVIMVNPGEIHDGMPVGNTAPLADSLSRSNLCGT